MSCSRRRRCVQASPSACIESLEPRQLLSAGVSDEGLVGLWEFDDKNGKTAADFSDFQNYGVLKNGPNWGTGLFGGALKLDGTNDYVLVSDAPALDLGDALTISVWLKPGKKADQTVVSKSRNNLADGYELSLSRSGKIFVRFNQETFGDLLRVDSTTSYPTNGKTWIHMAATYDGQEIRLFVNGVLEASREAEFTLPDNSLGLGIGADPRGRKPFKGMIDAVRIYEDAITEITDLATKPTQTSGSDTNNAGTATTQLLPAIPTSAITGQKPQSKVWFHEDAWWTVLPNGSGTWVWRLDGNQWTRVLKVSSLTDVQADAKAVGDRVHLLLFRGESSEVVSIEYDSFSRTYKPWSENPAPIPLSLQDTETATIDSDSTGRLWVAYDSVSTIQVRYSDSPYTTWSAPITLATAISSDDLCGMIALPNGRVGVMWSNQKTRRFGFRVHADDAAPETWSADEVPGGQSAKAVGGGMADDHINLAVLSDGTLYAAVKTSYDKSGYPKIAVLVRRPSGTWDPLYSVDGTGTRPIILLNEAAETLIVAYTSGDSGGNIVYRTSPLTNIHFGAKKTLISGTLNNVSTTKQSFSDHVVLIAGNSIQVESVLLRMI